MNKSGVNGGLLNEARSNTSLSEDIENRHPDLLPNGQADTLIIAPEPVKDTANGIEWDTYGPLLDMQADLTPDYWENVDVLVEQAKRAYPDYATARLRIVDIGAGTGNFTSAIAKVFANSEVVHLEPNRHMNYLALNKFEDAGLQNVEIIQESFYDYAWAGEQWDIVICVNALYMLSPQSQTLATINHSLKQGGFFYVVDFGREQDATQWFLYFLKNAFKGINTMKFLRSIPKWPQMAAQAKKGSETQVEGQWWTHETDEFGAALSAAGFAVDGLTSCYCGFADRAVCRPISK